MKQTTEQQIEAVKAELQRDIDRWHEIERDGSQDPFWPDGVNMNLKRNHIIYQLRRLSELEQRDVQLSMFSDDIYGIMDDTRIPPLVPDNYMVKDRFIHGRRVRK